MSKSATTTKTSKKPQKQAPKQVTRIAPIHPGEILLEEFMEPMGLSANALAKHIQVPGNRISTIVKGTRGITGDTALRLAAALGTTPEFWMNLQKSYELEVARDEMADLAIVVQLAG
ncbi:MAG: HigA family addiction module antitoxin [Pseudomonadota bacterium]